MARRVRALAHSLLHGETVLWPAIVVGAAMAFISHVVGQSEHDLAVDVALASMTTFLFGVLLAFTIARTTERLSVVQNLVSKSNAALLSIYNISAVFSEQTDMIRDLVDRQLTDQIDFRLRDNHLSLASHQALVSSIIELDPQTRREQVAYRSVMNTCVEMDENRALIEATTGQSLSTLEWTSLLLLLTLLLTLISVLPGDRWLGSVIAGALAGTLVTLMLLLRKLDLLRWHERKAIWEPTARLFRSMGRDPYVPREVISSGRYRPSGRVRLVEYPDPYPNRSTKIVTVTDLGPEE